MLTVGSAFQRFAALGYSRLVPIVPPGALISERSTLFKRVGTSQDGRGKTPGTRGRDGLWSSFDWVGYEADEHDLDRWAEMGAGVGIKTGQGLVAIDADTLSVEHATVIRDIVDAALGRLPIRVGNSPKALYLCRVNGPLPYARIEFGTERVEVLTDGKQFVAEGVHNKTGRPYHWPRELVPFDELPVFSPEQILAVLQTLRSALPAASRVITEGSGNAVNQAALAGPLSAVRAAVLAIPNTSNHFPSRESYRDMGYAIKAALPDDPDEALEIFRGWCDRWTDGTNDPDVVEADWRRMKPPFRRGASWLYGMAAERGSFDLASVWFEAPADEIIFPNAFENSESNSVEARAERFKFLTFDDAADQALGDKSTPLIKGLLEAGAMSVMYGDSNAGKTFVAMDMAFHIAAGLPYAGMKVTRGAVVYIAAEGGRGAKKRLKALRDKFGKQAAGAEFYLLATSVNLRDPNADLRPLIAALLGLSCQIAFLVVDTMSRALAGGDENSSVDVGLLIKSFDALRAATGAHLMVVHHSGKDRARGARGWSGLRAATDTEIEIADRVIAVGKQRDLDGEWSSGFELEVRTLGVDGDGDPVTSCTIRLVSKAVVRIGVPTATERDVLAAMVAIIEGNASAANGISAAMLAAHFAKNAPDMTSETLRFHMKSLQTKCLISKVGRGVWKVEEAKTPLSSTWFEDGEVEGSGGNVEENILD